MDLRALRREESLRLSSSFMADCRIVWRGKGDGGKVFGINVGWVVTGVGGLRVLAEICRNRSGHLRGR